MIRIRSRRDGFRRCGMAHSREPQEYPDSKFTKKQLAILTAEPMLTVEILKPKPKDPADKTGGKDGAADKTGGEDGAADKTGARKGK